MTLGVFVGERNSTVGAYDGFDDEWDTRPGVMWNVPKLEYSPRPSQSRRMLWRADTPSSGFVATATQLGAGTPQPDLTLLDGDVLGWQLE